MKDEMDMSMARGDFYVSVRSGNPDGTRILIVRETGTCSRFLFHPSAFILHPYLITPRLEDWINFTNKSTSFESLISSLILSSAWEVLSLEERRR